MAVFCAAGEKILAQERLGMQNLLRFRGAESVFDLSVSGWTGASKAEGGREKTKTRKQRGGAGAQLSRPSLGGEGQPSPVREAVGRPASGPELHKAVDGPAPEEEVSSQQEQPC